MGVTAPLLASISPPVGGDVTVTFNTVVGLCYKVEYTDAFSSTSAPSWSEVVPGVQKATGTTMSVVDLGASGSSPQRFYRVVQVTCPP